MLQKVNVVADAVVDTSGWRRKRGMVEKQVPFAAAVALTQTAKDAQKVVTDRLERIFDRPTPWTKNSITIVSAKKTNLEALVLVKDLQAQYLAIQETGGIRTPRPGKPINIPVNIRTNASGNIPRGAIRREVGKTNVFTVGLGEKLPPGIYRRARARRKQRQVPTLLVAVERRAQYRPRFEFKRQVVTVIRARWSINFDQAMDRALATAR